MKLSDLAAANAINLKLSENKINLRFVKDSSITLTVGGNHVLTGSWMLKERIQRELTDYYIAERDLLWNELKRLGVEVDL